MQMLYRSGTFVCMRTTLNIDDQVLRRAADITGVKEKTSLVRMGLACGNLASRAEILELLAALPAVQVATHAEALHLTETRRLTAAGSGGSLFTFLPQRS